MPLPAAALPVALSLAGGVAGLFSSRGQARGYERAGQAAAGLANQGYNYLAGSPIGTQYLPAGGQAIDQQAALLGLGGDPAAAQAAYQNYLSSIGYQHQMRSGEQAITGSAAARGLLGSGSTLRALTRFGQDLGQQSFGNYLAQLGGVAGMGLQAGGMVGQAATQGGIAGAGYQFAGQAGAADARRYGWDQLFGGAGGAARILFPNAFGQP